MVNAYSIMEIVAQYNDGEFGEAEAISRMQAEGLWYSQAKSMLVSNDYGEAEEMLSEIEAAS